MTKDEIRELIRRRRAQMLVHSYCYYAQDDPIISDDQWQEWAEELTRLQTENPDCCKIKFYDKEFKDWDGTTGMHLPQNIIIEQRVKQVRTAALHYMKTTDNYL